LLRSHFHPTTTKTKKKSRGNTIENTYRSGEKFETAMIEKKPAQFTYKDENNNFFFMDSETFEEYAIGEKIMDGKEDWVNEGMEVNLVFFSDKVIEVVVPSSAIFEIVETDPNVKGNSAQGTTKPAKLSCGATIMVPGYLAQGEMIKVDTDKKVFLERA
jgi:elongation factor P